MNTEYIQYPDDSMVWIYQSNRTFNNEEIELIKNKTADFIKQWDSHGSLVKGTFNIFYDSFIVIFADPDGQPLCGRAQTASVSLIKELETDLGMPLLDRMNLSYKENNDVKLTKMSELKKLFREGKINDDTIVFDNTVINKKDFDTKWESPLKDSWHKRFV